MKVKDKQHPPGNYFDVVAEDTKRYCLRNAYGVLFLAPKCLYEPLELVTGLEPAT